MAEAMGCLMLTGPKENRRECPLSALLLFIQQFRQSKGPNIDPGYTDLLSYAQRWESIHFPV